MKDHQILSNDSKTKLYMFNLENRYSNQSDLQNAKINVYKHKIKKQNTYMRNKRQFWAIKRVLRCKECIRLAKICRSRKLVFWGNLDDSVKSLLSNALNRDIMPSTKNL